jgi:Rieske 2Fe-2S family protein
METFARASVGVATKTLERRWYCSDDVFAQERGQIFGASWCAVTREERLARPGDFVLTEVAGESVIVTRDDRGEIRAYFNVCRHRGTRLCAESAGRFNGSIQCPYHAWTYGLDGTLLAARNMQSVPGFERGDYPLHAVAVATFDGFVFVNHAPEPEPFERELAPVLARFARWNIGALRVAREMTYDLACNWKLVFQNYSECYHCPLVHPQLDKLSPSDSGRNDLMEGPILGGYSELRHEGASLTTSGTSGRPPLGALREEDHGRVYYYTLFPSMLLSLHPDYVMVHYVTPLSARRTRIVCAWLFDPGTMAEPGFDPSDAVDFWDLTNRQDWRVNELTHAGIASTAYTPGPYAQQEGLLAAFDRHYKTIMNDDIDR